MSWRWGDPGLGDDWPPEDEGDEGDDEEDGS